MNYNENSLDSNNGGNFIVASNPDISMNGERNTRSVEDMVSIKNKVSSHESNPKSYNPPRLSIGDISMKKPSPREKSESNKSNNSKDDNSKDDNSRNNHNTTNMNRNSREGSGRGSRRRRRINTVRNTPEIKDVVNTEPGYEMVYTNYGNFEIPIYSEMSEEELDIHRNTFMTRFIDLNRMYSDIIGKKFAIPRPEESMRVIHIRFEQALIYIQTINGTNNYMLMFFLACVLLESGLGYFGIDAKGYTISQWKIRSIYESLFIRMGKITGFGEEWSPFTTLLFIMGAYLVIFITTRMMTGDEENAENISNAVVSVFMGGKQNQEVNEHGIPVPQNDFMASMMDMVGINNLAGNIIGGFEGMSGLNPRYRS